MNEITPDMIPNFKIMLFVIPFVIVNILFLLITAFIEIFDDFFYKKFKIYLKPAWYGENWIIKGNLFKMIFGGWFWNFFVWKRARLIHTDNHIRNWLINYLFYLILVTFFFLISQIFFLLL